MLSELQRAAAIAISNDAASGGDGSGSAVLIVSALATQDVAGNRNTVPYALLLEETPDSVRPFAIQASIDFGTGALTIEFSEVVDLSPLAVNVDVGKKDGVWYDLSAGVSTARKICRSSAVLCSR